MKLQKLLYYCQAGSLAWLDRPLFPDRIEAWTNGPVVVSFWEEHSYESWIHKIEAPEIENNDVIAIIMQVLETYNAYGPAQLSQYAADEEPCSEALARAMDGGSATIGIEAMREHYRNTWPQSTTASAVCLVEFDSRSSSTPALKP